MKGLMRPISDIPRIRHIEGIQNWIRKVTPDGSTYEETYAKAQAWWKSRGYEENLRSRKMTSLRTFYLLRDLIDNFKP